MDRYFEDDSARGIEGCGDRVRHRAGDSVALAEGVRFNLHGPVIEHARVLSACGVAMFVVAMGATYVPALRATRGDPSQALRNE